MNTWRTDLPPKPGYYEADFGDELIKAWLIPVRASDYPEDHTMTDGIVWGWDESDDPEAVEVGCEAGWQFKWREINA